MYLATQKLLSYKKYLQDTVVKEKALAKKQQTQEV
jgi:hypothetical protein